MKHVNVWRDQLLRNEFFWVTLFFMILATVLIVVFLSNNARAGENDIRGYLVVSDGDTGKINGEKVRLWGFDAFEKKQTCVDREGKDVSCGVEAINQLKHISSQGEMSCSIMQKADRYGRKVVRCSSNGEDVGSLMVRSGWAFDYTQYSNGAYKQDQAWANKRKMGVHDGMKYVLPWDYRKWGDTEPELFQKLFGK